MSPTPYYQDTSVIIYHGDCREVLPLLGPFDVCVTDPPYGVKFSGKATKHTAGGSGGYEGMDDTPEYVQNVAVPVVADLVASGVRVVLTPGSRNMWLYPRPDAIGAIFYPSGAGLGRWGFTCHQPIYYYGADPYLSAGMGHRPDSFSTTAPAEECGHPCPKPMQTMLWLVRKASLPGETVLDPFAGSGTTLRAAKDLGRRAIGIEIEERYCEIAAKRCAQETLFAPPPEPANEPQQTEIPA